MVRTGAYAYVKYGYEGTFGGSATIDKSFGHKASVSGWTLTTNRIKLGKLGQVEPSDFAYGTQSGSLSVGFVLADETSHELFKSIYGAGTGSGTHASPIKYPATNAQGAASKTFVGQTFSTEIGFTGETDTMVRTAKGCILNTLNISATMGDVVNCSADISYGIEAALSNTATTAASETSKPFTFAHGALKLGGATVAEVQEVDITFSQNGDLLYELGSQQAVTGVKRTLDITGRFKASWKNDDAFANVVNQLATTATNTFKETYGAQYTSTPEFELYFTNGVGGASPASGRRDIKITCSGLSIGDHSVSGLEPVEPVFEEINWQVKTAQIEAVDAD
jgi:hypothetical protein